MRVAAGTRLGPYVIEADLGAGGMGEVYRGRDTRLDRTVAIKVLTGVLAADAESRLRFEHEARAIAALNDPHICTIHDVGRQGDLDYLVLEYLEGEPLSDRLHRAPPVPLHEALEIAIQIADALARAHRAGIAHRDLKPANVMLLRRGGPSSAPDVKLLDFGLAARLAPTRAPALDATVGAALDVTQAPAAPVAAGFSGTVQYMAPERLDGEAGDHRADIFAFGCVLYEMLAGRKAFEGGSAATVIAAIMQSEPPSVAAFAAANPLLEHIVLRCLEKDRERRWQSLADVAGELRWVVDHPPAAVPAAAPPSSRNTTRAAAGLALVFAAIAVAAGIVAIRGRAPDAAVQPLRFEIATPPTDDPSMALSPDGSQVAFVANQNRVPVVWVRALDRIESRALAGTEGASLPFWSPDGREVAFFAGNELKRVDLAGGTPIVIAHAPNGRGGTWGRDGTILFAAGLNSPILRVPVRGGAADRATQLEPGSGGHRWPHFLPDGRRFLFSTTLGAESTNGVHLGSLDGTPPVRLVGNEVGGRFAAPDRLLTIGQGALLAYRFDPAAGRVEGEPVVVAQGFSGTSNAVFATSDTGVLAYRVGTAQRRQLVWVDRQGTPRGTVGEPDTSFISSPELSTDERSVVVFLQRTGDNDIWTIEVARSLIRRLTDGQPAESHPLWDPDGGHVVFNARRDGVSAPERLAVAGGKATPLRARESGVALSWTRDRQFILMRRESAGNGPDLVAVSTTGDGREVAVAQSQYAETEGQFSPDGRRVAFVSTDNGRPDVFVQSFPEGRGRTQVSTGGGTQVRWSGDGREIFYIAPDGRMMAVSAAFAGPAPVVQLPVPLFQTHLATGINVTGTKPQYAVARDGRFLLNTAVESHSAPIVVSVNWIAGLRK